MTKLEMANLIASGLSNANMEASGPSYNSKSYWDAYEAAGTRAEREALLAAYLARTQKRAELENWLEILTRPEV